MALTLKTGKLSEGMALCTRCEFPPVGAKSGLCPVCTKKHGAAEAARPVGKRSAAGRGASVSNIPVGNHGDNLQSLTAGRFVVQIDTGLSPSRWEDNSEPQGLASALSEAFALRAAGWSVRVLFA